MAKPLLSATLVSTLMVSLLAAVPALAAPAAPPPQQQLPAPKILVINRTAILQALDIAAAAPLHSGTA